MNSTFTNNDNENNNNCNNFSQGGGGVFGERLQGLQGSELIVLQKETPPRQNMDVPGFEPSGSFVCTQEPSFFSLVNLCL